MSESHVPEELDPVEAASVILHSLAVQNIHVALPTVEVARVLDIDMTSLHDEYGCLICPCKAVEEALFAEGATEHPMVKVRTTYVDLLAKHRKPEGEK